jgi:hypothetical protein
VSVDHCWSTKNFDFGQPFRKKPAARSKSLSARHFTAFSRPGGISILRNARRDSLDAFSAFHMAGHWDADGSQMTKSIQRVVARRAGREPRISAFLWWLLVTANRVLGMQRISAPLKRESKARAAGR